MISATVLTLAMLVSFLCGMDWGGKQKQSSEAPPQQTFFEDDFPIPEDPLYVKGSLTQIAPPMGARAEVNDRRDQGPKGRR